MISEEDINFISEKASKDNAGPLEVEGILRFIRRGEWGGTLDSVVQNALQEQSHDPHMISLINKARSFLLENRERFKL